QADRQPGNRHRQRKNNNQRETKSGKEKDVYRRFNPQKIRQQGSQRREAAENQNSHRQYKPRQRIFQLQSVAAYHINQQEESRRRENGHHDLSPNIHPHPPFESIQSESPASL